MSSPTRVLHVLSQRPGRTGSGVTLEALVREAAAAGWEQEVALGTPATDPHPPVTGLDPSSVHPLVFGEGRLPFPLPGMSDVMPYESSRWGDLDRAALEAYRHAWRDHLAAIVRRFQPDVIHTHHLWIVSALAKDVAPGVPVVTQSHATGLRQMVLCPHLADEVASGCRRNERILALTHELGRRASAALEIPDDRVAVVGAGYREDLFHPEGRSVDTAGQFLYAGKYSRAKGLPWLLDAVERIDGVTLHVAGSGSGEEADALRLRMEAMAPRVVLHGHLDQPALAALMRRSACFVLPSFYEGLPLVVVEAAAAGCRVVCTDLPTVWEDVAPALGGAIELVPLPRLHGPDEPEAADLPRFVDDLTKALRTAIAQGPLEAAPSTLGGFTWSAVFHRVEQAWRDAIGRTA